jgi:hypothetical protein
MDYHFYPIAVQKLLDFLFGTSFALVAHIVGNLVLGPEQIDCHLIALYLQWTTYIFYLYQALDRPYSTIYT